MHAVQNICQMRNIGRQKILYGSWSQMQASCKETNQSNRRSLSISPRVYNDQRFHQETNGSRMWLYVGIPLGTIGVGYNLTKSTDPEKIKPASPKTIEVYKLLPLRHMSRLWGKFNNINLPEWSRHSLLSLYANVFGCNVQEAAVEDLRHYKNLGEFFRRALKPSARPINTEYDMVMPSDGRILNFGTVDRNTGMIEQVKGINYSVKSFLGPHSWLAYQFMLTDNLDEKVTEDSNMTVRDQMTITMKASDKQLSQVSEPDYVSDILGDKEDTTLYQIVIYLAPGDYHRFHSPVEFNVKHRRHFPGELLSVNPGIARRVPGLFSINERAVYYGKWKGGFLAMSPVGATNVGSITTYFDRELTTNNKNTSKDQTGYCDKIFPRHLTLNKGDLFGEFNLGSTIVLIFEAPKDFRWAPNVKVGATVKMGEPLGDFREESAGQPATSSNILSQDVPRMDGNDRELQILMSGNRANITKQNVTYKNQIDVDQTGSISQHFPHHKQLNLTNENNPLLQSDSFNKQNHVPVVDVK